VRLKHRALAFTLLVYASFGGLIVAVRANIGALDAMATLEKGRPTRQPADAR
jgi:hypothetical protein